MSQMELIDCLKGIRASAKAFGLKYVYINFVASCTEAFTFVIF